MGIKQDMIDSIESQRDDGIRMLQALVRAASPNPPGETTAAAAVLANYLTSKGIHHKLISPKQGQPNIVSEFEGGSGPGPRVVLNGHMDVFPVDLSAGGWQRDPWSGDIADGRIHGRGVVDMKSGTASMVIAYQHLYEQRKHLKGTVALCMVSDEETGGAWGTRYLLQEDKARWGGDVMLTAEPTGRTIRFSEKGTLRLTATVRTKGGHGAYPNLSKGAIRTAASFLSEVTEAVTSMEVDTLPDIARHLTDPEVLKAVDRAMGEGTSTIIARPTVNVGTIRGGVKVNVIPELCTFELDIRLPIGLTAEEVLELIHALAQNHTKATIEIEKQDAASNPSSYSTISHPIIGHLAHNAKQVIPDYPATLIPSMGATDCKHYRYAGIPAYAYGCSPFSMAAVNESASISEFVQVTKVLAGAVCDFLA
ncbi:hypothetical protein PFICI_04759 [Pestalotiopsis fici W106-1]|uniref:Peptidase M20 dimerisation domain-containing protein n=1 Tax=Pestalotiopsis fici (strain W106-1 / CGMCC3.15140) TaxID=1229662 RepID=W3X9U6_PESFW|nr:uncharacterized protein PFICI_04759 [Pestalotiopsis fici W106-1]ETS82883.1 hypothetical protein PFICI_04759 [Pestalotiopsis fici W106-1]